MTSPDTADPREAAEADIVRRWENGLGGDAAMGYVRAALAAEPSAGVTSEAADLAEAIGRAAGIDPAMVDVDEAARRLSRGWDERRAALADRWPGPDPMTRFEMFGAVNRDAAWGLREFAPESGVIPDDLSAAAYDRRGLLNVVASLLDRLADTPSTSTETPTRVVGGGETRLIDTKPKIGALTETIELEIDMHNPVGPNYECDCGDQIKGETFNHHVAALVDYRLTATAGDA